MQKAKEIPLPEKSLLHGQAFDFTDCFEVTLSEAAKEPDVLDMVNALFLSAPPWISKLMWLRNRIVSLFGLKTGEGDQDLASILTNFNGEIGDRISLFKVVERAPHEIVFSEKDKHLDFWLSLMLDKSIGPMCIQATTTVNFNNRFGKVYFALIKPFHKLIVKAMLNRTAKHLKHEPT
ncbi:MAG: DUF2867 domain-containing protein [Bacteroidota bacterium]